MKADNMAGTARLSIKERLLNSLGALQGPIIAFLGAILVGAFIIAVFGSNPIVAYWAMLKGAFAGKGLTNLASTLNRAVPIVGMGLAAAIAFKAGFVNIGGEGQIVLGGITAALVSIYLPLPSPILLPVTLLSAAVVGGLYALLAMVLEFRFNVPLLISTLNFKLPGCLPGLLSGHLALSGCAHWYERVSIGTQRSPFCDSGPGFASLTLGYFLSFFWPSLVHWSSTERSLVITCAWQD